MQFFRLGATVSLLCAASAASAPAWAQSHAELVSQTALRVCADPHDLPLSNEQGQGYENKIAEVIGRDLKLPVAYTFFPDSQGFIRATLLKDKCDVVMGTVAGVSDMDTTQSYLHTGYMMVTREADHIATDRVGDPSIAGKRFGIVARTPPTDLIVQNGLMEQTAIYSLVVDTRVDQPVHTMLLDLAAKKIDVALLWGPFAGYYIQKEHLPLKAVFVDGKGGKVRLDYHIAMGVRTTDTAFRRRLNEAIGRNQAEITHILDGFGVPQMDEEGHPLAAGGVPKPG